MPLVVYLRTGCLGHCTGISFIASPSLAVRLNQPIHPHNLFAGLASLAKPLLAGFFGFKLHLVVNDRGEILSSAFRPATWMTANQFCDWPSNCLASSSAIKGMLPQPLKQSLRELFDVQLITKLCGNMKNQLMTMTDRILLRRQAIIETIID